MPCSDPSSDRVASHHAESSVPIRVDYDPFGGVDAVDALNEEAW